MTAANAVNLKKGTINNESANFLREMNSADEKGFCFFASSDNNVLATNDVQIKIDSVCTNYMLKDRRQFASTDESFSRFVGCPNSSESKIKGKSRPKVYVCEDNGRRAKITLSEALFVPDYVTNVISESKLKNSGKEMEFGDNDQIVTKDGTVFRLMQGTIYSDVVLSLLIMRLKKMIFATNNA